jgi:hypothetical protein
VTDHERMLKRVQEKVRAAIKAGILVRQPCEVCGELPGYEPPSSPLRQHGFYRVVAHHEDYSKPLEVRWFCVYHHAARHRTMLREQTA